MIPCIHVLDINFADNTAVVEYIEKTKKTELTVTFEIFNCHLVVQNSTPNIDSTTMMKIENLLEKSNAFKQYYSYCY